MVFAFGFYPAYSQNNAERSYGFSIAAQGGVLYGQAFEYVYPTDTKGEFLSELIWDMKPVFYLGLQIDFGKKDVINEAGFFSLLSFKAGIPGDSGKLEDRDWMSIENSALTNFSSHTNKTRQFFSLDAAVGVSVPLKAGFIVKPFISASWMHFAFTGRDGYYKYARKVSSNTFYSIDDNPETGQLSGDVIYYKQNWLLLSPGVSFGVRLFYPFSIDFSFKVSLVSYCSSRDDHIETNTTYLDFTRVSLYYEPAVCLSYSFKRIEHSLEFSWKRVAKTEGESYLGNDYSGYGLSPNKAGAGLSVMDLRYLIKFHF